MKMGGWVRQRRK